MDIPVINMFLEIPRKISGMLYYEQNRSNKTLQGHKSDTAVHSITIDEMPIVRLFLSS